jgi:hypothetical protein
MNIDELINKIKIVQQCDYRVADILFKKGPRWRYSHNKVITDNKYNGTILQTYLKKNEFN